MTLDSRRRIALFLYTFHFKSHFKIHRIRRTAYPAVLPSHTLSSLRFVNFRILLSLRWQRLQELWVFLISKIEKVAMKDSVPNYFR